MNRFVEELIGLRDRLRPGWIGEVERDAGHASGYMSRVFRGKHPPDGATVLEVLARPEVDASEMLAALDITVTPSPAAYLTRISRQGGSDPVLEQLERAMMSLAPVKFPMFSDLPDRLRRIDELRFTDPAAAAQALPELIDGVVDSQSPQMFSLLLSAYAEDKRFEMSFGLAARALRSALGIAPEGSHTKAIALQRLAYLVYNHGWLVAAEAFAREASDICLLLGHHESVGKMLVTRAVMAKAQGKIEMTLRCVERALSYLPESTWTYRSGAYLDLAWCHQQRGNREAALAALERATQAHRTRHGVNWLKLFYARAELALEQGDLSTADAACRTVLAGFQQQNKPIDTALAALRLSRVLLMRGRLAEIEDLTQQMIPLLTPLRSNQIVSAAILRFYRAAQTRQVTLVLIDRLVRILEESGQTPALRRD